MEKTGHVIVAVMLFHAAAVWAQDAEMPNISFNGYGTAGVVRSNEDQADFISSSFVPDGAGYSHKWSPEVDSRLGLQLTAEITPKLTGIVQVVAEQRYDDTYTPTLEWANLKYDITPDLSVRVGRMVLPTFLVSGYRKVGYALPWVRPPVEVYQLLPVPSTDGAEISYRFHLGEFTNTLRVNYGRKDTKIPGGIELKARDGWTVTNTLEHGDATLFTSYSNFRLTIEAVGPLFDAFRQFGPEGEAIADRYDVDGKRLEIINIGVRYDPGDWFVMGEWARFQSRSFIGTKHGWYVSGGYRFGPVTPYATFARSEVKGRTSAPGLNVAGLPPPLAAGAQGLNAALNDLLGSAPEQNSVTLGARWDFFRNLALKVQYDYIDLGAGSPGVLINEQPGFNRGGSVSLFSATIDFVF